MNSQPVSLSGLAKIISHVFRQQFNQARYWVVAEVAGMKLSRGHCYLQLVEKDDSGISISAEFRAIIWSASFQLLNQRFEQVTGKSLQAQLQVLCMVEVQYHERFGLNLIIHDLDPSFTLGRIEQEKRLTIERLKKEGVYPLNKQRPLPLVIRRIAVISAEDSKGYEDFITRLRENRQGYPFNTSLYSSLLQGKLAAPEIIARIRQIELDHLQENYDAIVIVRGGGSATDLGCFDDYQLARTVALCTLPVITGIGHTANRSITDEVAHLSRLTPTDVAVFLVDHTAAFENTINGMAETLASFALYTLSSSVAEINGYASALAIIINETFNAEQLSLQEKQAELFHISKMLLSGALSGIERNMISIIHASERVLSDQKNTVSQFTRQLNTLWSRLIRDEEHTLELSASKMKLLDPQLILRRGYSYTMVEGKIITNSKSVKAGNRLTTIFAKGSIDSIAEG